MTEGQLVLADGSTFEGELIGAHVPISTGEVVFNTVMSGYQEVITDPSYAGQIITFTYPHIGNYGINATDFESVGTFCRGIIVRDLARRHSNIDICRDNKIGREQHRKAHAQADCTRKQMGTIKHCRVSEGLHKLNSGPPLIPTSPKTSRTSRVKRSSRGGFASAERLGDMFTSMR